MNIWKRRALLFSLLLFLALAAGAALKVFAVPWAARRRLISAVHDNCETCELSLNRVHVSLLPFALSGSRVRLTGGTRDATVVQAEADSVYVPLSLFAFFKRRLRAGRIIIEKPVVKVTEGDMYSPESAKKTGARGLDFEIEGVELRKGTFIYIREHLGSRGSLCISGIDAAAGPVGNSDRLRGEEVEGSAIGRVEGSGQFHLGVKAMIFAKVPNIDVKLQVAGQDLGILNGFFTPIGGIKLEGNLIEVRGSAAIRGEHLASSVFMRYKGLSVNIRKNKERGGLSAFFQNLMSSLKVGKQNVNRGNFDRVGTVELERKPKETFISLTLRGMKEAAMKVSSRGGQ